MSDDLTPDQRRARTLARADAIDTLVEQLRHAGDEDQAAEWEAAAAQMREGASWPTHCWCGKPVQDRATTAPPHRCRQCAEHCEIARYERACRLWGIAPAYARTNGRPSVEGDPGEHQ